MKLIKNALSIFIVAVLFFATTNCTQEGTEDTELKEVASCEGCHTNYEHLKEVFSPDTEAPAGGCGGEAPHYEPYDRVYMGGSGYYEFKQSGHYAVGCVGCHNGVDNTKDKDEAHSGDFLAHPSAKYQDKCGGCHKEITDNFTTSIHHGTGQKRKVTMRSGLSGHEEFDKLPEHQIEGYNKNCATCHGTCGNCHIVRPPAGGGGLTNGHSFTKTPDMVSICVTCHVSRGGHAYLGVATGTKPDVHLTNNQYTCMNCHTGDELHGDGEPVEQRYAYSKLPKCENCHSSIAESNKYHTWHYEDFNCQVCHSQDYNNCGSCHVHGDGARIPSYLDFKIARNPIPDIKQDYKFVLVRRAPSAPDTWKEYGVDEYANFEAFPTYNYTSPHNILRWTSRTTVEDGQSCYESCHIREVDGEMINKELYLFDEYLLDWEKEASKDIVVDGHLPTVW